MGLNEKNCFNYPADDKGDLLSGKGKWRIVFIPAKSAEKTICRMIIQPYPPTVPPSTERMCAVTIALASDARKIVGPTKSSGSAALPRGILLVYPL